MYYRTSSSVSIQQAFVYSFLGKKYSIRQQTTGDTLFPGLITLIFQNNVDTHGISSSTLLNNFTFSFPGLKPP